VHTIAATATNSLDLKRNEGENNVKIFFLLTELSFHFGRCFFEWKHKDVVVHFLGVEKNFFKESRKIFLITFFNLKKF
jgi:hypothetical protein